MKFFKYNTLFRFFDKNNLVTPYIVFRTVAFPVSLPHTSLQSFVPNFNVLSVAEGSSSCKCKLGAGSHVRGLHCAGLFGRDSVVVGVPVFGAIRAASNCFDVRRRPSFGATLKKERIFCVGWCSRLGSRTSRCGWCPPPPSPFHPDPR